MSLSKIIKIIIPVVFVVAGIHLLDYYQVFPIGKPVLLVLRLATIGLLTWYGFRKANLTTWILLSMVIGTEIGVDAPAFAANLDIFSKIFLNLIKTAIAPLLFGTLVVGIAGHGNIRQVGRMGVKALIYFEVATTIALFIGLAAINISQAGVGIKSKETALSQPAQFPVDKLTASVDSVKNTVKLLYHGKELSAPAPVVKQDWKQIVLHSFPENISKMIYDGMVLQIVVFSMLFGFGLTYVEEKHRVRMLSFAESLSEVMFKFVHIIMYIAPFAVGGAIASTIGTMGIEVVSNLLQLLSTLYVALIAFIILVFIPVMLFAKIPIRKFFAAVYEPASLAFATASSEAALPKAMLAMEKFGVPRKIVSFVLPTGYSFNLDGSTLYLSLAAVFCAQAAGIHLDWSTQIFICLTLMLTSKGVAGVPRASLVILAGTVAQFGIPEWPIAVILGIDALMDMGRTCVNLMGNCLASAVVAKWEGEFDENA